MAEARIYIYVEQTSVTNTPFMRRIVATFIALIVNVTVENEVLCFTTQCALSF